MSRVERTRNPGERRGSEETREAERGRSSGSTRRDDPNPGHTPGKAEGEPGDVEQALENQKD
jgi:hypothetical protein